MVPELKRGDLVLTRDAYGAIVLDVRDDQVVIGQGNGLVVECDSGSLHRLTALECIMNFAEWMRRPHPHELVRNEARNGSPDSPLE